MDAHSKVTVAGVDLGEHRHICGLFNSQDEEFECLLPFVLEGIGQGEKAFHIIDPDMRDQYIGRMRDAGVEVDQSKATGQVEVRSWSEAYLKPGWFDQDHMLALIQEVLRTGKAEGYPLTRLVAHMEWSLAETPGVEDLIEYESRLNDILPQYDDPVICTYDVGQFTSEVILGVLRTHPMVLVGGILHRNPLYVEPDRFLEELRSRKAKATMKN